VALLLLPPALIVPPSGDHIPLISLPLGFDPRPDPFAGIKKHVGRVLDRIIGYVWWLLVLVGAGHAAAGIGNFILGFGAWTWWTSRQAYGSGNT